MSDLSSLVRDQTQIDAEHLRLLAIFHFVLAGLACCGLLFVAGHYAIFHAFLSDPTMWEHSKQAPPPAQFLTIFRWFYAVFALWFAVSAVINVLSGLSLRARRHRVFSMVVAGLNCMHMPFGTILGVSRPGRRAAVNRGVRRT